MSKRRKKKNTQESADAPDASPARFRAIKAALAAVVTAAVGCAAVYGLGALREQVAHTLPYQVSASSLRLVEGPSWMTPGILAELDVGLLDPDFPQRFSLLDEGVTERIAAAYERCVWVERVKRIEKHDPRVDPSRPPLEIVLKFRRPMAFVRTARGCCLLDADGVRLPGMYREPQLGAERLLVVRGVSTRQPAVGQAWSDASLSAGLRVARAVESRRQRFRLASVDVSNFGGRRDPHETEIALVTASGTRIKWGKAPSPEAARLREKSPAEKLAYLAYVYEQMGGRVDGVLAYIDIPNEAVCRRSATAPTLRS
ncbi:MAG: cell division protein FtsQ/DivIB [Planctomycetota bacterium]|nr:cell division protein FtsQ/DivIB [Planctomycetota bacterium]